MKVHIYIYIYIYRKIPPIPTPTRLYAPKICEPINQLISPIYSHPNIDPLVYHHLACTVPLVQQFFCL